MKGFDYRNPAGSTTETLRVLDSAHTYASTLAYVDAPSRGATLGSLDSAHTYASALAYVDTTFTDVMLCDVKWRSG
jgi:hypothetical protein